MRCSAGRELEIFRDAPAKKAHIPILSQEIEKVQDPKVHYSLLPAFEGESISTT